MIGFNGLRGVMNIVDLTNLTSQIILMIMAAQPIDLSTPFCVAYFSIEQPV